MSIYGLSEMGLSAQAIAGGGVDHPHDPSDLRRCIGYCERMGISTETLQRRMAGRSPEWDRLLPEWDRLVAILKQEMDSRTDGRAPLTYIEMKILRFGGTKCVSCAGTGRGVDCAKCKGTGRRSGGKCRAEHCYRGADFCRTCSGRGYTKEVA